MLAIPEFRAALLSEQRQRHGDKRAKQSCRQKLRRTAFWPIGTRGYTTAVGCDIQYRDLLHLWSDQNCEHFAFLVHGTRCH